MSNSYDVTEVYEIVEFFKTLNKNDHRRFESRKNISLELNKIECTEKENYTKEDILKILRNIL
ncbi:hypothetical protein [Clostridium sp. KNHs214]|uniref:hypothetical protein n=1 Tax=Clostridium sp. KNHs214 TaxID=1540257 RepID=UPI000554AF96|nr:hypothetical protein [Clostridium sp. KNHs214]